VVAVVPVEVLVAGNGVPPIEDLSNVGVPVKPLYSYIAIFIREAPVALAVTVVSVQLATLYQIPPPVLPFTPISPAPCAHPEVDMTPFAPPSFDVKHAINRFPEVVALG
tara:strand:+ start:322 stop:648 length:327 start_codon:yes stop_codon:yes gene_type:complete